MTQAVTDHFKVIIVNFQKKRSERSSNFVKMLAMVDSAIDRCNTLNPNAKKDSHDHKNHPKKKKNNRKFKKPPKAFDRKSNS